MSFNDAGTKSIDEGQKVLHSVFEVTFVKRIEELSVAIKENRVVMVRKSFKVSKIERHGL